MSENVIDWNKAVESMKKREEERCLCVICKVNKRPRQSNLMDSEYICPSCETKISEQQLYDHAFFLVNECDGNLVLLVKEILRLIPFSNDIYVKRK